MCLFLVLRDFIIKASSLFHSILSDCYVCIRKAERLTFSHTKQQNNSSCSRLLITFITILPLHSAVSVVILFLFRPHSIYPPALFKTIYVQNPQAAASSSFPLFISYFPEDIYMQWPLSLTF